MHDGRFIEVVAATEERYRQQVLNPKREHRARLSHELALMAPERPARPRRNFVAVWLGNALVRTGEWLGASASGVEIGASQSG
jgi:hypothetical protein